MSVNLSDFALLCRGATDHNDRACGSVPSPNGFGVGDKTESSLHLQARKEPLPVADGEHSRTSADQYHGSR